METAWQESRLNAMCLFQASDYYILWQQSVFGKMILDAKVSEQNF